MLMGQGGPHGEWARGGGRSSILKERMGRRLREDQRAGFEVGCSQSGETGRYELWPRPSKGQGRTCPLRSMRGDQSVGTGTQESEAF